MIKEKTMLKRCLKALMYARGLVEALDSDEVIEFDETLEKILKGKKTQFDQDAEALGLILKELGIKP